MEKKRKKTTSSAGLKFMERAIKLAHENVQKRSGGPFGAVIVKDGKVVAEGYNQVTALNDPTAHAEVQAIRAATKVLGAFELTGCDLYTSCEPCPMCLGAIYWARPDRVFFAATRVDAAKAGFDDELIYQEIGLHHTKRKIPMKKIKHVLTSKVFEGWNKKSDKIEY